LRKEGLTVERLRGLQSFVELSVGSDSDSSVIHFALDSPFRFEQPSTSKNIPGIKIDSLIDIDNVHDIVDSFSVQDIVDKSSLTIE
jgi:hypothetical protein